MQRARKFASYIPFQRKLYEDVFQESKDVNQDGWWSQKLCNQLKEAMEIGSRIRTGQQSPWSQEGIGEEGGHKTDGVTEDGRTQG
jgi:hypothetical protein